MGGKSSKEKKEDPAQLNQNTETLKNTQTTFALANCTDSTCSNFSDYKLGDKIKQNNHKYKFFIFLLIFFIILVIIFIYKINFILLNK